MKHLRTAVRFILCLLIGGYLLLLGLFKIPFCQRAVTQLASQTLSSALHTRVSIGEVEVGLFNRVLLRDVHLEDQQGRPLLTARVVSAKIELRSLFREQICLRTVSLLDAAARLSKPSPDAPANYQFVLDALASKDKDKAPKPLNLSIRSVILRRVALHYDETWQPATPHLFNPAHVGLTDINANISLRQISGQRIELRVRSLSFREQCGLALNDLRLKCSATRHGASIPFLHAALPHSRLRLDGLEASYRWGKNGEAVWPTLHLTANLSRLLVHTDDLRPLLGTKLPEELHIGLDARGQIALSPDNLAFRGGHLRSTPEGIEAQFSLEAPRNGKRIEGLKAHLATFSVEGPFVERLLSSLSPSSTSSIPATLGRLGHVNGTLRLAYDPQGETELLGNVQTDVGTLTARLSQTAQKTEGEIKLTDAAPAVLLKNEALPSLLSLHSRFSVVQTPGQAGSWLERVRGGHCELHVDKLQQGNNSYEGLLFRADYAHGQTTGQLHCADPTLGLDAEFALGGPLHRPATLRLSVDLARLAPAQLGLTRALGKATLHGRIALQADALQAALPTGELQLQNFSVENGPHGDYHLQSLLARLEQPHPTRQKLTLRSDFLDADLEGPLSAGKAVDHLKSLAARLLPGIVAAAPSTSAEAPAWTVSAQLKRTDILRQLGGIDLSLQGPLQLSGKLDTGEGRTSLTLSVPGIEAAGQAFGPSSLFLSGSSTDYSALLKTQKQWSGKDFNVALSLHTTGGNLQSRLAWRGQGTAQAYHGDFCATTGFRRAAHEPFRIETTIHPTEFTVGDSLWQISSGHLLVQGDDVAIDSLRVGHALQSLTIDGRLAKNRRDSLVAHLHEVEIDYILSLVNFDDVAFGGRASGTAVFTRAEGNMDLRAALTVPDFSFNYCPMGAAQIYGKWEPETKHIVLDADMVSRTSGITAQTTVAGYIAPSEKALRLDIGAHRSDLRFLNPYVEDIFDRFGGDVTGDICLYGPFKKLDFQGDVTVNAEGTVRATGVHYRLSDGHVALRPGAFTFSDFKVSDLRHGQGTAQGQLRHTHLKRLNYDFYVEADNLLCYDQPESPDMPFYSTAYGTGHITLGGRPGLFAADISLSPTAPTFFVYTQGAGAASEAEGFVRFHEARSSTLPADTAARAAGGQAPAAPPVPVATSGTDIYLNLNIAANPTAELRVITDPRTGDQLSAFGTGSLRATYHNKGSFELYGTYRVDRGSYKMSIQDVIRKNMALTAGSTLTFTGNPLDGDLDLRAVQTITGVPLSDLNYAAGFAQKTAKVDCILHIGGKARSPQVNFDLDFQNITDDERQMVRQLIATDDDLNRQAIYLLGIGRFYTTSAGEGAVSSSQQNSAAMRSLLSTTLTGQLNEAISNALGSRSQWSFGTNFTSGTTGWNDLEVDGQLQGRLLNDRLLINGNLGYRDRPTSTSNFVGDFDIRYLLTPKGGVSLRAYSETTDRYFTRSSLTTQGVGLSLQRDFTRFWQLFRRERKKRGK